MKKVIKQYTAARTAIGGREPTPPDQPADWATLPFTCRSLGRAAFSDTRRKMTAGLIQTAHSTGRQLVLRRSEPLVSNSRRVAKLRLRLCRTYAGSGFGPSLVQEDDRTVLVAAVRASLKSTFFVYVRNFRTLCRRSVFCFRCNHEETQLPVIAFNFRARMRIVTEKVVEQRNHGD